MGMSLFYAQYLFNSLYHMNWLISCCFSFYVHCRRYHWQQNFRPIKSVAESEAHLPSPTSGSTSACRARGAYLSAKKSSQEHRLCSLRTLCRRSLEIKTRESRSWRQTLSGECPLLKSWRNVSSWSLCQIKPWKITGG